MSLSDKFTNINIERNIPLWDKFNITETQFNIIKKVYDIYSESYDIHIDFVNNLNTLIENNYDKSELMIKKDGLLRDRYDTNSVPVRLSIWYLNSYEYHSLSTIMFYILHKEINKWRIENNKPRHEITYSSDIFNKSPDKLTLEEVINMINMEGWWI